MERFTLFQRLNQISDIALFRDINCKNPFLEGCNIYEVSLENDLVPAISIVLQSELPCSIDKLLLQRLCQSPNPIS